MRSRIKVLHVTFDMTIGGTQQVIRQIVENINPDKIYSELLCIDNQLGDLGKILSSQGIKINLLNRQSGFDWELIAGIRKLIKSTGFDIVHCHQYTPYMYGLFASLLLGVKVIFTEHGRFYPDFGTWKRKLLNPIFSLFTYQITSISEATKLALVEHENFSSDKIKVIYNGIVDNSNLEIDEVALKREFNIPKDAFIFSTISRLQPIKNQKMMIEAFKGVYDLQQNTHLVIVGDGEIRDELELLTKKLSLQNAVTFTGFQNNPYRFHKIAHVFLLTSFSEGTSMTLLESMSFSKPAIVTNVGGNPELIKNEINGYIIQSENIEELKHFCLKFVNNPDKLYQYGNTARKIFKKRFEVENMIRFYISLYEGS